MESGRVFQRSQKRTRLKIFWFTALPLMVVNPWLALGIALLAYRSYDIHHDITPVAFSGTHKSDLNNIDGTTGSINSGTLAVTPANPKFNRSIFK